MKWNAAVYDRRFEFVTRYGTDLLDLLDPQPGERILDVGCGTGHLTAQIAARGAIVTGLDNSGEMVSAAREHHPDLTFVQADAAEFRPAELFDAVFSNAALHWVHRAAAAAGCMAGALRPGGRFVVEFGGRGNVQRICSSLERAFRDVAGIELSAANYFPGIPEYTALLEKAGIEVTSAVLFDRPTRLESGEDGLADWVRMFRRPALEALSAETAAAVLSRVASDLRDSLFRDGAWYADYRRLRIVGRKPDGSSAMTGV